MLRHSLPLVVVLVASIAPLSGQDVGSTPAEVRQARGEPMMTRQGGGTETWIYADGTRVQFRDGVVASAPRTSRISLEREEDEADNVTVVTAPAPVSAPAKLQEPAAAGMNSPLAGNAFIVFVITVVVAKIWFLALAFKESLWWGLGCIFIPVCPVVFLVQHWHDAKKPFLLSLAAGGGFLGILVLAA